MRSLIPVLATFAVLGFMVAAFFGVHFYLKVIHVKSIVDRMSEVYSVPKDAISGELLYYQENSSFRSSTVKITLKNNFSLDNLKKFCGSVDKLKMKLLREEARTDDFLAGLSEHNWFTCMGGEFDPDSGSVVYGWYITPGKSYIYVDT